MRRNQSHWMRFNLFSEGYGLICTESIDALDNKNTESGWEILYFYFRAPVDLYAYLQIDSMVSNARTADGQSCKLWVDNVTIVDMGTETYTDIYNTTPPATQYGIRNRYFEKGTETETVTLGSLAYSCQEMPVRWNIGMALDNNTNHADGYPVWGQKIPPGLNNFTGEAGFVRAKAADTSRPAWPAICADGVNINSDSNNGQRHILTFDYGSSGGQFLPLLRVFMIKPDFSHYTSLFVDPVISIPGERMWPLTLHYTPEFGEDLILVRFDNITIGPAGSGVHTNETTIYLDNVIMEVVSE